MFHSTSFFDVMGNSFEFFFPNRAMKCIMITYEYEGESKYDEKYDGRKTI